MRREFACNALISEESANFRSLNGGWMGVNAARDCCVGAGAGCRMCAGRQRRDSINADARQFALRAPAAVVADRISEDIAATPHRLDVMPSAGRPHQLLLKG